MDDKGDKSPITVSEQDGVFFAINIDLPTAKDFGTRSQTVDPNEDYSTSNGGVEIGQDYENYVGEVIVVLARHSEDATKNNSFIAAATVPKKDIKTIGSDGS